MYFKKHPVHTLKRSLNYTIHHKVLFCTILLEGSTFLGIWNLSIITIHELKIAAKITY